MLCRCWFGLTEGEAYISLVELECIPKCSVIALILENILKDISNL